MLIECSNVSNKLEEQVTEHESNNSKKNKNILPSPHHIHINLTIKNS